jgi:hypothetical protein
MGQPLPWSTRTRFVKPKYQKNEISKKNLNRNLDKELTKMIMLKMGLIQENNENMDPEHLGQEREKRLMNNIIDEVK